MLPYGRQTIESVDIDAVVDVMNGNWLTTGPSVAQFEEELSSLTGGHSVTSCTSGTAALHIAYSALGLQPGDEVICAPMTFVATASSASLAGATVTFADVDPETGLIDPASVAALITEKTRAIAAVDYAGHACDYAALRQVVGDRDITIIGDAAHSVGGHHGGRPVGDLADVTAVSFFPTKNLTTGEGGAVICKDPELGQRVREFHNIGLVRDRDRMRYPDEGPWHQEVHQFGLNYRLNDISSALGLAQLRRLAEFKKRRDHIVERYNSELADVAGVLTPVKHPDADPMWHLYPARIQDGKRAAVYQSMRDQGIGVQVNYIPVYWHPVYEDLGHQRGLCPGAETFYNQQLSLPLFPTLTDDDVTATITALKKALSC